MLQTCEQKKMQKGVGGFALGVPESIRFSGCPFCNDFSLVTYDLSSISVSFDYVLWDFVLFSHHFSYTVYLKDQLSLVWQLMLCVCLSNNRVVCIKAV